MFLHLIAEFGTIFVEFCKFNILDIKTAWKEMFSPRCFGLLSCKSLRLYVADYIILRQVDNKCIFSFVPGGCISYSLAKYVEYNSA